MRGTPGRPGDRDTDTLAVKHSSYWAGVHLFEVYTCNLSGAHNKVKGANRDNRRQLDAKIGSGPHLDEAT